MNTIILIIKDSEKEATKQRISELEEVVTQLKDELRDKVRVSKSLIIGKFLKLLCTTHLYGKYCVLYKVSSSCLVN